MVGSWLLKVIIGIALAGAILIEVGSPLITKAQADDAAHEIANEAAFRLRDSFTQGTLDETCKREAEDHDVSLVRCEVNSKGEIEVRVRKEARSLLLKNWSATEDWYYPEVTAVAEPK